MIAHVAEAGEARGRVVLRFCSGAPNEAAIRAAFRLAAAFRSEIESLYVEDKQLLDLANYAFATEISYAGGRRQKMSPRTVHESFMAVFAQARRRVEAAAREADVPLMQSFVRDEPMHALAAACAQRGPWNVIALAEAFGTGSCASLEHLFRTVPDTTGVILAGPKCHRTSGPVVVAVEDLDRFPAMLRAAERLAALMETNIVLLLIGEDAENLYRMDGEIRLILADRADVALIHAAFPHGEPAAVAEAIRRLKGSFLIAHFGSLTVPSSGGLRPLASALESPLFLVR